MNFSNTLKFAIRLNCAINDVEERVDVPVLDQVILEQLRERAAFFNGVYGANPNWCDMEVDMTPPEEEIPEWNESRSIIQLISDCGADQGGYSYHLDVSEHESGLLSLHSIKVELSGLVPLRQKVVLQAVQDKRGYGLKFYPKNAPKLELDRIVYAIDRLHTFASFDQDGQDLIALIQAAARHH